MKLIDKDALVAEIERLRKHQRLDDRHGQGVLDGLHAIERFLDTLEVKESKLPNPRFPHLDNIVDKVFGTGNLESFEYEEAEQLVLLAKEELLKDLEVKDVNLEEVDFEEVFNDEYSKFSNDTDAMDYAFPIDLADYRDFAKHFFKLGISVSNKAQKGE